ncbi:Cell cycle and apoptosis regulator protein 2 [Halotydeus destructor]|nr:Cell cycle and apoptosis regulator protein 2 [Halotydeus destructor]
MGNFSSCCLPDKRDDLRDETDRLLHNPAEAISDGTSINGHIVPIHSSDYGSIPCQSNKPESNAWTETLHKMASNVIDVSTMEVPATTIEQSDWIDRQRAYAAKINQTKVSSILRSQRQQKLVLKGDNIVDYKKLASQLPDPISVDDLALINEFSEKSLNAITSGFVVTSSEDLVVQFNPRSPLRKCRFSCIENKISPSYSMSTQANLGGQPQHKAFTGRITKLLDTFGFVDDEVFFQLNVVRGGKPKIGDQVYVDCSYSEELPFKWNAICVQILQSQGNNAVTSTYMPQPGQAPKRESMPPVQSYYSGEVSKPPGVADPRQFSSLQNASRFGNDFKPQGQNVPRGNGQQGYPEEPPQFERNQQQVPQQFDRNAPQAPPAFANPASRDDFGKNQITYTSTPGSAFVSAQIPPYLPQQPPQAALPQPQAPMQKPFPAFKGASRWEPRREDPAKMQSPNPQTRDDPRMRREEGPPAVAERDAAPDRRERNRERDRFGRDKDRAADRDRKVHNSRRSTESPMSATNSIPVARPVKRRYEPMNIPKYYIAKKHLTLYDVKLRYGPAVHIPSDFKEIDVNTSYRFSLLEIPKPLTYSVTDSKELEEAGNSEKADGSNGVEVKGNVENADQVKAETVTEATNGTEAPMDISGSDDTKPKKIPRYGVKVLLLSLPSMAEIYERVIGLDKENKMNSKAYHLYFNKLISLLCIRSYNDGHSFVGGKYNVELDGFFDGTETPNLIATAVRCTKAQTGIDLSPCKKWVNIATFAYNRDESVEPEAELDYSVVYIPDVWSLLDKKLSINSEPSFVKSESIDATVESAAENETVNISTADDKVDCGSGLEDASNMLIENQQQTVAEIVVQPTPATNEASSYEIAFEPDVSSLNDSSLVINEGDTADSSAISATDQSMDTDLEPAAATVRAPSAALQEMRDFLDNIGELKVVDLRNELKKRDYKIDKQKKADLVILLTDLVEKEIAQESSAIGDEASPSAAVNANTEEQDHVEDTVDDSVVKSEPIEEPIIVPVIEASVGSGDVSNVAEPSVVVTSDVVENVTSVNGDQLSQSVSSAGSSKRKLDADSPQEPEAKKTKVSPEKSQNSKVVVEPGVIVAKGDSLDVVTLFQVLGHRKYDHFELIVTAELLRESLVYHFANYVLSCLIFNKPLTKSSDSTDAEGKTVTNAYALLAFSYFDSNHCGYIVTDDLLKVLHNCGFSISKKGWSSLVGDNDKIYYRSLNEPDKIFDFKHIDPLSVSSGETGSTKSHGSAVFMRNGSVYDIIKLIEQSEDDEKMKASFDDKLKALQVKLDAQKEQITEFETRHKKMTSAVGTQNDEICSLKREKEALRVKHEDLLKLVDGFMGNITTFSKSYLEMKQD